MRIALVIAASALLASCGGQEMGAQQAERSQSFDVREPSAPVAMTAPPGIDGGNGAAASGDAGTPAPLKVAIPQMAYTYGYTFRLDEGAVDKAQARHVALCDSLGVARCQVLAMRSAGGDEDAAAAALKLRVASNIARRFGAQLTESVAAAGGRAVSSTIAAEDVSKDIVDTEARLRQRELLVARLTEILRTRQGKVAELVEAERSVAAAQEEIDQAKGWLTELRSRVAMSTVDIAYQSVAPGPAAARGGLADSFTQSASVFVAGLSALLQVAIFLAPWAVLIGLIAFAVRRFAPRIGRWRRREGPAPESAEA